MGGGDGNGGRGGRRIGVLGGTFDPIHVGHLVAAVNVRHELSLDSVLLVVANEPWQKVGSRAISPGRDRLAMVRAAVGDVAGVEASDLELVRGGASYTADTLAELRRRDPDAELFLIVGADVADDLDTWIRVEEVRALARLVVVNRPGADVPVALLRSHGWEVSVVTIPALEISSTDLRARASDGRPLDYLVPEGAIRCIREAGLYASTSRKGTKQA
ncbi:MAG TPA: nicotinate-nucleotide adenylyltransferase [Acidimicrobiales bacterium]|nr:nicotinate-nucleotide adenylyltransferase [Acidimicrobiales bacterium]